MLGRTPTMPAGTPSWVGELRAILALSWPLALGNLAQVAMGTTDVMMMGWLSADTLAAGALGANLYFIAFIFGAGLLNAATPMMARTLGRDHNAVAPVRGIVHLALLSAAVIAVPFWIALWWSEPLLLAMGQNPALAALAGAYVHTMQWALLPAWGFIVLRSFISALEQPVWSLIIGLGAIVFNAAANWCLMLGHCGCHALGISGSGLATSLSSLLMVSSLGIVASVARPFRCFRLFSAGFRVDRARLREFWRLGLPMAATLSFEVTMFNAAVFLMGLIGAASLAVHSIAIQLASLTFMVPLGIGQAATVRVGRALGRRDREAIHRAGWTALGLAIVFMAAMALIMVAAPRLLISAFLNTNEPANAVVVGHAASFLMLAAAFQIADGAQTVGAGILRGLHDTRMPMLFALLGYWAIGLPLSASLAFAVGLGGIGIWIGLATGLAIVAVLMIGRWFCRETLGLLSKGA
ncbi:MATE family efflux transporter [Rhodopila globiformis]|uniref:MATE family efflux transporter n=2 Tax=Rhodopila globiformis TaxID=1071 RepID=A0A2S6NHI0_RHOGL|nr:MATE family efflux transporter [Rhodopila globiformis]